MIQLLDAIVLVIIQSDEKALTANQIAKAINENGYKIGGFDKIDGRLIRDRLENELPDYLDCRSFMGAYRYTISINIITHLPWWKQF